MGAIGGTLLERATELAVLAGAARDAAAGLGTVVLLSGEAGIGKSSLVEAVRDLLPPGARLLIGNCDDLSTPRVLGPLRDLGDSVGAPLREALERGDRGRVLEALRAELLDAGRPTVLVVEDVHSPRSVARSSCGVAVTRAPTATRCAGCPGSAGGRGDPGLPPRRPTTRSPSSTGPAPTTCWPWR